MNQGSFDLQGKVALVTGASRGLGMGIAEALDEAGATVVGTSREEEGARCIAERFGTLPVLLDVTELDSIQRAVRRVGNEYGKLDILVNNAGVNVPQGIFEVDEKSWDTVLGANLKGAFFTAQAAASEMVARKDSGNGGRIINIGSQAGEVGIEERSAYCASKGGLATLTKVLAIELARYEITVNTVSPTFVSTELTSSTLDDPVWRERILSRIPLGRIASIEEVAAAVTYLVSPAASMVTGHSLLVDGGWTAW